MDTKANALKIKEILVGMADEQEHLKATITHLDHEITKRELIIHNLKAENELQLAKSNSDRQRQEQRTSKHSWNLKHQRQQSETDENPKKLKFEYDSKFTKQISHILGNLTRKTEEVSKSIEL